MGRTCSVCAHPEKQALDKALAAGTSKRELSAKFRVSEDAITRHAAAHLPAAVVKAAEVEDVRQALDVVAQLKAINAAALRVLQDARQQGDGDLALKAIDRIFRQIELQAKLIGELDERPQVNVILSPQWVQVRAAILAALLPYGDARTAVASALTQLEAS